MLRAWIVGLAAAFVISAALAQQPIATTSPSASSVSTAGSTTISTTAPVTARTTIDLGTYAGQALMWVASVFGTTIGAALTALFYQMLKNVGIQGNELLRQKLQDIIVNGLNAGAKDVSDQIAGRAKVEVKNEVVAKAVDYVQQHGADTLKKLGIDPTSEAAIAAIKARIETAINDPTQPTPPVLDGAKPVTAVAATVKT